MAGFLSKLSAGARRSYAPLTRNIQTQIGGDSRCLTYSLARAAHLCVIANFSNSYLLYL